MTKNIDLFWQTNDEWWDFSLKNGYSIKPDAPEEAKKSFEQYLKDIESPYI